MHHYTKGIFNQLYNRYDYDPCRYCLTIQMPSPVNNIFCAKIVEEILRQLKQLEQGKGPHAYFAKEIGYLSTSRITIPDEIRNRKQIYSNREPDASFKHRRARYPGIIIKVYYLQKVNWFRT